MNGASIALLHHKYSLFNVTTANDVDYSKGSHKGKQLANVEIRFSLNYFCSLISRRYANVLKLVINANGLNILLLQTMEKTTGT